MEYQAKSDKYFFFKLMQNGKSIGKLSYKSWFKFDAEIEFADQSKYKIEPKGFWGTTVELKDGAKVLLKFTMNWNGEIVIQTFFDEVEKDYIFRQKGVFKDSFIMTNPNGVELLAVKPDLKWFELNYEYQISTSDAFEELNHKDILLMNALHCANYFMTIMMSGMA